MSLATHVRKMARNNAWSNHRLLSACAALSVDEFKAPRTSFFPSLHATCNHILAVDRYYIDALVGGGLGPSAFQQYVPFDEPAQLKAAQLESDRRLIAFCDAETDQSLTRQIVTNRGKPGRFPENAADLLAHLFQHQIHHRGQVHAMLAGTPVPPPQIDEYFLDFDKDRRPDLAEIGVEGPEAIS